jgi:hypothetical protein
MSFTSALVVQPVQAQTIPIHDIGFDFDNISDFPDFPFFLGLTDFDDLISGLPDIGEFDLGQLIDELEEIEP